MGSDCKTCALFCDFPCSSVHVKFASSSLPTAALSAFPMACTNARSACSSVCGGLPPSAAKTRSVIGATAQIKNRAVVAREFLTRRLIEIESSPKRSTCGGLKKGRTRVRPRHQNTCLKQLPDQLQPQLNCAVAPRAQHRIRGSYVRSGAPATE